MSEAGGSLGPEGILCQVLAGKLLSSEPPPPPGACSPSDKGQDVSGHSPSPQPSQPVSVRVGGHTLAQALGTGPAERGEAAVPCLLLLAASLLSRRSAPQFCPLSSVSTAALPAAVGGRVSLGLGSSAVQDGTAVDTVVSGSVQASVRGSGGFQVVSRESQTPGGAVTSSWQRRCWW